MSELIAVFFHQNQFIWAPQSTKLTSENE